MIVALRTGEQAAKVAVLTGGVQLPGEPKPDGTAALSRYVDMGADFERCRSAGGGVGVGFVRALRWGRRQLCRHRITGCGAAHGLEGDGGEVRGGTGRPRRDRAALVRSHFGARRFAFNWGLAHVKADLDARTRDPDHESVGWDLGSLRKVWNRAKHEVAPWWATNSKEAYSAGLADLAQALSNWNDSRNGRRCGRRVGFPRFKSRAPRSGPGALHHRHNAAGTRPAQNIVLPVIGLLRSTENTRRVQRHLAAGRAQILNMTLSQRWGRLFVSINYALRTPSTSRARWAQPTVVAGVDLGVRTLATVATIDSVHWRRNTDRVPESGPAQGDAHRQA